MVFELLHLWLGVLGFLVAVLAVSQGLGLQRARGNGRCITWWRAMTWLKKLSDGQSPNPRNPTEQKHNASELRRQESIYYRHVSLDLEGTPGTRVPVHAFFF